MCALHLQHIQSCHLISRSSAASKQVSRVRSSQIRVHIYMQRHHVVHETNYTVDRMMIHVNEYYIASFMMCNIPLVIIVELIDRLL